MNGSRLELARWLVDAGAGASARNVLGSLRGAAANRLRLAADEVSLRPGIHGLVGLPEGTGAVLPLRPTPGHPRAGDASFREACVNALQQARALLGDFALPMLRFELEEELAVLGPSIGLPAALAFVSYFAGGAPLQTVLATGELLADGRVARVGHVDAKHAIARREAPGALVLFPPATEPLEGVTHVSTFAEASALVFGASSMRADVTHTAVDDVIHRARRQTSMEVGIALLESLDARALAPADRARVLFDLGSYHRNLGRCHTASRIHREARTLLNTERQVIGEEASERYELESWATEIDEYRLGMATTALRERLAKPFLKLRNELRCRGMLAQGLAMNGKFEEALLLRAENLALHDRSGALARVRPATLCHRALDAALAGNAAVFDETLRALCDATRPGDESQWRWNATVIVRGLVALGRDQQALRWSRDEESLHGCRVPATLALAVQGAAPLVTAPEISALRALVRATRREGRVDDAIAMALRTLTAAGSPTELAGWVAALLDVELSLADRTRPVPTATLLHHHEAATKHHAALLSPVASERERELDRIWL